MTRRTGRKRKNQISKKLTTGRERKEKDLGTPELQAKRNALAVSGRVEDTTDSLSLLCARGFISEDQKRAGVLFMIVYYGTFGKPFPRSTRYDDLIKETLGFSLVDHSVESDRNVRMSEAYKRADDMLRVAGRRVCEATKNVAVYDRYPAWARREPPRLSEQRDSECVIKGLDILCEAFGVFGSK